MSRQLSPRPSRKFFLDLSAPGKRSTVPAPKENYHLGMRRSPLSARQSVQKVPSLPPFLSLYEVFRGEPLMLWSAPLVGLAPDWNNLDQVGQHCEECHDGSMTAT